MAVLFVVMNRIRTPLRPRARRAGRERGGHEAPALLPSRVHAIVLVAKIHKPTLRASPTRGRPGRRSLEALTVDVDPDETRALQAEWDRRDIPVPLKALDSPFREITRPVVDYVKSIRSGNPRDLVVVYIPQYVVGHWWEQVLHNQSALRLGPGCSSRRGHGLLGAVAAGLVRRVPRSGWTARSPATCAAARADARSTPGSRGRRRGRGRRHRGRPRRSLRGPPRGPGAVRPARPPR